VKTENRIENIFGRKVALCLICQNWKYKEQALKFLARTTEKYLASSERESRQKPFTLVEMVDGSLGAVNLTCREKVIKVFNISLHIFN